ncbi:MAG TPA: bifunctional precorrin-2 dehydrogenase/sirohydrochlorin ferrochelatase [Campylobacterales bacterium]|nr:bifunctional precorrin-2 dehydrogenase/sirohydrochlorin ferrochelatase [Campylobacterales bacterium]HHH51055.1 bifunctional precorrin-2 dehydrogenase/sirohydrochlorin ferrochelatase [Campylobacterales bacterium]
MSFFPSYLNLNNKKILLIGGGYIALEKLEKLIDFTTNITVIAKEISPNLLEFANRYNIVIKQKSYKKGDIDGFDIVIVATNTIDLHEEIYKESRNSRILVNSVDDTAYCDFIFPSYIKKGDLTISISTSGASPAMAKRVRLYIENLIPSNIGEFLKEMRNLRKSMPKGKDRMRFFEEKSDKYMQKYFKQ